VLSARDTAPPAAAGAGRRWLIGVALDANHRQNDNGCRFRFAA